MSADLATAEAPSSPHQVVPTASRMRRPASTSGSEANPPRPKRHRGRRLVASARRWARRALILAMVLALAAGGRHLGLGAVPSVVLAVGAGAVAFGATGRRRGRSMRALAMLVPAIALLGLLASTTWSYTGYLEAAGAAPVSVRTGNWMRDHHMSSIVDQIEQRLYAGSAPSNGKVDASQLPAPSLARPSASGATRGARPVAIPSSQLLDQRLRGEGQWTLAGRLDAGHAVAYTSFVRPDRHHSNVVAAGVWLDPNATRITYVPGTEQPGTWAWGAGIPTGERSQLVGAFNGGFRFRDHPGGYRTEGQTAVPLVRGKASLVLHRNGPPDLGRWGTQVSMTPDTVTVRQNLDLIVDGGQPVAGLRVASPTDAWGHHNWQLQYTNRSGLGITKDHALIFVAGRNLTTGSLAAALADLGAVRGMELDIHATNPTFNFFDGAPGSEQVSGTHLTPSMKRPTDRFLAADQRDFFAVTMVGSGSR